MISTKMIVSSLLFGFVTLQSGGAGKALSDDDWRVISKAIYKCGQITADQQWRDVIKASKSKVNFQIDPAKSDRDWQFNHCDDVLRISSVW